IGEYRKVGKSEKVEFEKPYAAIFVGDTIHIVLRDGFAAFRVKLYRRVISNWSRRHYDTCRMHADVPRVTLDFARKIEYFSYNWVFFICSLQVRRGVQSAIYSHRKTLLAEGN